MKDKKKKRNKKATTPDVKEENVCKQSASVTTTAVPSSTPQVAPQKAEEKKCEMEEKAAVGEIQNGNGMEHETAEANEAISVAKAVPKGQRELRLSSPIAWSLEPELGSDYCNFCLRPPQLGRTLCRCSGCKWAHFCDAGCQRQGWEAGHRQECTRLRKVYPRAPSLTALFFARLTDWLLANNVRIDEEAPTPADGTRSWANLFAHSEHLRSQPNRISAFFSLRKELKDFLGELPISDSDLWMMYCKKTINSHGIFNVHGDCIGQAIDLQGSYYDHSCRSNVSIDFDGKTLILRSLDDDVDIRDVKRAFVIYCEPIKDVVRRRDELSENYAFTCTCERCSDPSEYDLLAIRCQACTQTLPYFGPESVVCTKCGVKMARGDVNRAVSFMALIPGKVIHGFSEEEDKENMFRERKELEAIAKLITDASEYLAPSNIFLSELYIAYFQKAIKAGTAYEQALKYARLGLVQFRRAYHPKHKKLGFHLLRLILLEIKTRQSCATQAWKDKATEAQGIFAAWYGEEHVFTRNVGSFLSELSGVMETEAGEPVISTEAANRLLRSLTFS